MVPPAPASDDHIDPAWLGQIRSILGLNQGGVVIGLEGAHLACAGPLVDVLLEDRAEVRICFAARELLDAPEDARVVLLHAERDAEFLNLVRPVVSERRLRLLVWLRPGDRRELRRRARDFLDWMQESVSVPAFVPAYATLALRRALEDGASISWEGLPLRGLIPETTVLLTSHVDEDEAITAMREGPVVIHRPRDTGEVARFEAMYRAAGARFGIIWNEPAILPAGATRVIAQPLDWEVASEWLVQAGVEEPRIAAARLHLDPMAISHRAGREPPPMPAPEWPPEVLAPRETKRAGPAQGEHPRSLALPVGSTNTFHQWWEETYRLCEPLGPPEDPTLIVERPAAWPGLGSIADRLQAHTGSEIHVVTGATGSGLSTELLSLGLRLHHQRCVVMFDVWEHFTSGVRDPAAIERLTSWELIALLGLAAIRVGRDRWKIRWGTESQVLGAAIGAATGASVDVGRLASALAGAGAPDARMSGIKPWTLPMGAGNDRSDDGLAEPNDDDWERVAEELARVSHDPGTAMLLAREAGFPREMMPQFDTARVFWARVMEAARDGAVRGGVRAILDEAAKMYPYNELLARRRSAWSSTRTPQERHQRLTRAVQLIVEELRLLTDREVIFIVDGLDRLRQSSLIDELLDPSRSLSLSAALILTASPDLLLRTPAGEHLQTIIHLDDLPVIDVYAPTQYGPGIAFFRELLERRFASNRHAPTSIPDDVLDRLCWASGGRPQDCLRLVCNLATLAIDHPGDRLHDLAAEVLRDRRTQLAFGVTREGHELLGSLLQQLVEKLPDGDTAHDLYSSGVLRLYPTPKGSHRALPHPLLIEGLLRGSIEE